LQSSETTPTEFHQKKPSAIEDALSSYLAYEGEVQRQKQILDELAKQKKDRQNGVLDALQEHIQSGTIAEGRTFLQTHYWKFPQLASLIAQVHRNVFGGKFTPEKREFVCECPKCHRKSLFFLLPRTIRTLPTIPSEHRFAIRPGLYPILSIFRPSIGIRFGIEHCDVPGIVASWVPHIRVNCTFIIAPMKIEAVKKIKMLSCCARIATPSIMAKWQMAHHDQPPMLFRFDSRKSGGGTL
jgi:hypothetical protein